MEIQQGVAEDGVTEINGLTGDITLAVTAPLTISTLGNTITFGSTATGTIDGTLTANELVYGIDSNTIGSLAVATYPSLTEISYVKGVTSAIQTQINGKQATLVSGTNIKTINGNTLLGSGDLVIAASPGGSDTYIQFNDGGAFGGESNFTFNKTTDVIGFNGHLSMQSYTYDSNIFIGIGAGLSTASSSNAGNIAIGKQALDILGAGFWNTCIGQQAGSKIVDSSQNTYIGHAAGLLNAGSANTFIGLQAGYGNTGATGEANVAVGRNAGVSIVGGSTNTIVGQNAGFNITSGSNNICIGSGAGNGITTSTNNIVITNDLATSLSANNTIVGSLISVASGAGGLCLFGTQCAGNSGTSSFGNATGNSTTAESTLIGTTAGQSVTGNGNTFVGAYAGQGSGGGGSANSNVAIGHSAFKTLTTAIRGVAIGYEAGSSVGAGGNNILIGYRAGDNITSGDTCIIIGYDLDADSATGTGQLNIGGAIKGNLTTKDITPQGNVTILDAKNIILDTTTGTKIGTATTQKLGFYNATPVVQPTALTAQLTDITFTAPGTPDYAIQDLTNIGPYGFVTQDEGNTVLSVIKNLQTRVQELEDKLQALGLLA